MIKFLYLAVLFISFASWAQDSRWIDLEWEAVLLAREYEIELFQEEDGKVLPRGKYKTDTPQWSHAVPAGKYFLRLRSVDKRGVPGEWSPNIPLKVRLSNPLLLRPASGDKISDPLVNFEWGPVDGAGNYQVVVRDSKKDVIHNALVNELKSSVYVGDLGSYQWAVFALEKNEDRRSTDELSDSAFSSFSRVGGLLEAPKVDVKVNDKVIFGWDKVRGAQVYQVDYFPPANGPERNRRFNLKKSPLSFPVQKLREGVTTLSVKSTAPGYQDSNKSVVKLSKSGDKVVVEDILQGREVEEIKTAPTRTFFRNELYLGVTLSQFRYESENFENDTRLSQSNLSGLGFFGEWNRRPTLNSLNRKLELSFINLSSGIDSGYATRLAYTLNKEWKFGSKTFSAGAGLSYLGLPAFMGNRFDNKVKVEASSSLGPDFQLGLNQSLNDIWEYQAALQVAYHPIYIRSRQDGGKAYPWMRGLFRIQRYYTEKQAFFGQLDYQKWSQEWKEDSSTLSGVSLSFGINTGF